MAEVRPQQKHEPSLTIPSLHHAGLEISEAHEHVDNVGTVGIDLVFTQGDQRTVSLYGTTSTSLCESITSHIMLILDQNSEHSS